MRPLIRFVLIVLAVCALASTAAAQCSFSISPSNATFPASGGNGVITITASAGTCARSASSNVSWVTISFGQAGTGNGTAGYTVLPNNTNTQRSGTLSVAGQTFTVTQSAGTCTYQFSPSSASVPAAGGTGSFDVTTGCTWTASTTASWITITGGSGSGDGTVGWTAAANTTSSSRTGTITIGSTNFTISQAAACLITLSPSAYSATSNGGSTTISINTSSTCDWTATSQVAWITLTGTTSNRGPGNITMTVAQNTDRTERVGSISVNEAVLTVRQAASNCTILLTPREGFVAVTGGVGTFAVTANCPWTVASTANWVRITSPIGGSGSGSGTVAYEAGQNYSPQERGGLVTVGSATFVVRQPGAACSVSLDSNTVSMPSSGGTATVNVGSLAGCSWTATSSSEWIKVTAGASGTGEGRVSFTVDPNPAIQARTGYIVIGSQSFQVVQEPAGCSVSVTARPIDMPAAGGTGSIPVTANCRWQAAASEGWIQITSAATGTTDSTLTFIVQANNTPDTRRGSITINGQTIPVTQAGQTCALRLSSTAASLPARGGNGSVSVTGGPACNWSADSTQGWLRVEWSSVSGSGLVRFSAEPNTTGSDRSANITVSGQTITVVQPAVVLRVTLEGVVNAASFLSGSLAPGEIVTIFGTGFGPAALIGTQLTTDRRSITTLLSDTRVLFDDVPSPMVYTTDGQISAIVPYAVAGKQTTSLQVEYLGVTSNAIMLPVALAAPAIFSAGSTGRGQGAILNQDYSLNGAQTPAARGSIVQIFATGEGQTRPPGVDGRLGVSPLAVPVQTVRVFIGGFEATVTYAGGAQGLVAGALQVNARVPNEVTPGSEVPVVLRVGNIESPATVTLAVR